MGLIVIVVFLSLLVVGAGLALRGQIGDKLPERDLLRRRTAGLTARDRLRVRRAVQKGRAVGDPALAAAAVARTRYGRAYGRRLAGRRWRWAFPVLAVFQFIVAGQRLLTPTAHAFVRWSGAGSSVLLGVLLASIPWQQRFYGHRADRAEQLNLGVLYEEQQQNR
jgi:hypothetical protein